MAARSVDGSSTGTPVDEIGDTSMTTKKPATETGTFPGELPYVRLGNGPENLVILPGITLENEPPNRLAAWTYRLGFGRFAEGHTVYLINRRRDMPSGYTTQDMAAEYARVMEEELGPSRVMGFSTGGSIAQYVALDHPELVQRLVLIVTASRLSEEGRETCERWRKLARGRRWRDLRADMASVNVTSEANKCLAGAFMTIFGRFVLGTPSDPSDFLTTLEADLGHDTTDRLPEISVPTLIIGGSEDPFFSEALLHETAGKIPGAELRVYEGVGHGVPKERKRRYEDDALAFLSERSISI
jgi:pimeloyl-ACP methyl ester carboxylesterase